MTIVIWVEFSPGILRDRARSRRNFAPRFGDDRRRRDADHLVHATDRDLGLSACNGRAPAPRAGSRLALLVTVVECVSSLRRRTSPKPHPRSVSADHRVITLRRCQSVRRLHPLQPRETQARDLSPRSAVLFVPPLGPPRGLPGRLGVHHRRASPFRTIWTRPLWNDWRGRVGCVELATTHRLVRGNTGPSCASLHGGAAATPRRCVVGYYPDSE